MESKDIKLGLYKISSGRYFIIKSLPEDIRQYYNHL